MQNQIKKQRYKYRNQTKFHWILGSFLCGLIWEFPPPPNKNEFYQSIIGGNRINWTIASHTNRTQSLSHSSSSSVLEWDPAAMQYARLSYEGQAHLTWIDSLRGSPKNTMTNEEQIKVTPMLGTIDRRSSRQRRNSNSCSTVTWVALSHSSELIFQKLHPPMDQDLIHPTCAVCYQWANPLVAQEQQTMHLLSHNYSVNRLDDATVCVTGVATFSERQRWQSAHWHMSLHKRYLKRGKPEQDERDSASGFAWSVWCELPNIVQTATTNGKTMMIPSCEMLHPTSWSDELQRVYLTTSFTMAVRQKQSSGHQSLLRVDATWPWRSLVWDEFQYDPPPLLDLPKNERDLKLLWAEGPLWQGKNLTLQRNAPSGLQTRFLLSILQQASIAPQSTRLLGVIDSQARLTFRALQGLLNTPVVKFLPWCTAEKNDDEEPLALDYGKQCLIPLSNKLQDKRKDSLTLGEVLEKRQIQIKVIPFPIRPSLFGTVRQMGQHAFGAWLGVRFSPEYHVLMYIDSDAIPFLTKKQSSSLQQAIYNRMFRPSLPCVNQRFQALEYAFLSSQPPQKSLVPTELACIHRLLSDSVVFNRTIKYCTRYQGHVLARCDAMGMMYMHNNYAKSWLGDLPPQTQFCPSQPFEDSQVLFPTDEIVEIHLRSKRRGNRCICPFHDTKSHD